MKKYFYCFLIGIGVLSGLEPFGSILGGALSGVGLLYLGWSLRNSSIREILFFGIIASASITIFAFNWVIYALWMITGGKFFYSVILFLIYCLLSNLKIVLFLLLSRFLKRFRISFLWLSAALISFLDIFTFQIFPWYFGNLISGNLFLKQSASIFGVFGLSFLSVLLAGIFIRFVSRTKKSIREKNVISLVIFFRRFRPACLNSKSNLFNAILPVVIILCLLVFGLFRLTFRESGTGPVVVVGFIQPDTGKGFRKYASDENFIQVSLNKIFNLSLRALYSGEGNIDLLILPESAVPFHGINPDQENRSRNVYSVTFHGIIAFLTRIGNADVFFNEMNFKEGRLYNLASILRAGEKLPDSYVKQILLPFGEFVPFSNQFPWLRSLFSETGDYVKGRTAKNIRYSYKLKIDPVRIDPVSESQLGILNQPDAILSRSRSPAGQGEGYFVPLICYEAMFPVLVREFFQSGISPDFIVNITNDSWFGGYLENYQHYGVAMIRAIEMGVPLIRPTLDGVSGAVDEFGIEIIKPTEIGEETYRIFEIKTGGIITFYRIAGDLPLHILNLLIFAAGFVRFLYVRRHRDHI